MQTPTTIEEVAQLAGETNYQHYSWYSHTRNKNTAKEWLATDYRDIKLMADTQGYELIPWAILFEIAIESAVSYRMSLG